MTEYEEVQMENLEVGDMAYLTNVFNNKTRLQGEILSKGFYSINVGGVNVSPGNWTAKREAPHYALPTKPGIYVVEGEDYYSTLTNRVFMRGLGDLWLEKGQPTPASEVKEHLLEMKYHLKKIY